MKAAAPARPAFGGRVRERPLLPLAFALSAGVHGLIYAWSYAKPRAAHPPVELDLTMSGHIGRLAAPRPAAAAPSPPPAPAPKAKEWVKSDTKPAPLPDLTKPSAPSAPEPEPSPASGPSGGEYGIGDGSDSTQLTRLPQLKNLGDLNAILRRFYPEEERLRGRGGTVVIDLHVDPDGRVISVDVVKSATPDFDEAARKVGLLLRFTPAYVGTAKVAVKLRQAIQFNLAL
ncbi:MAG: energy transducer TonB [Elusimicrobiota bacterium]